MLMPRGPEKPIKPRWVGLGRIRMSIPDVEELYDQVPLRKPAYIG